MTDSQVQSAITGLTGLSAALVAVSLAIVTVIPTYVGLMRQGSGSYTAEIFGRWFRRLFIVLFLSVIFLVLSALAGMYGLFWPSVVVAGMAGALGGVGVLLLTFGAGGFALLTLRSVLHVGR